jgi:molybdate transport system substrate-binding protein
MRKFVVASDMLANTYRTFGLLLAALVIFAALFAASCSGDDNEGGDPTATGIPPTAAPTSSLSGSLTVFAAASLTDAFNEAKEAFVAQNPDVSIEFNFAGSSALVTQLQEGAPADVFASAAQKNMVTALENGSVVDSRQVFAKNRLAVIVPKDNPANIQSPCDLSTSGVKLVIAEEGVPVGDYARQAFTNLEADAACGACHGRAPMLP